LLSGSLLHAKIAALLRAIFCVRENPRFVMSADTVAQFVRDGFVRIDNAFDRALAGGACAILWRDTGCDPNNPTTWTRPVVRLGMYSDPPFVAAANTPVLHRAYDALVGAGRWLPCGSMGTFPVRFPSPDDPGDAGWHIDVSFGYEHPDFMQWRANVNSRGRALLMLFLSPTSKRTMRQRAFESAHIIRSRVNSHPMAMLA
jgi:hypothetical protein